MTVGMAVETTVASTALSAMRLISAAVVSPRCVLRGAARGAFMRGLAL
jgi:hypothetical protein